MGQCVLFGSGKGTVHVCSPTWRALVACGYIDMITWYFGYDYNVGQDGVDSLC